jgi:hypothetical protein
MKTGVFIKSTVLDAESHVSVIHPIKDMDFELEKNLASWKNQEFTGKVQHIFSFQNPEDPAIQAVSSFMREYPGMDWTVTVNPLIPGFGGKGSNMAHAIDLSKYGMLLFTDNYVRVQPDYVTRMTRPLADPKVGVMTSSQLVSGGRKFWTGFVSFTQNSEANFYWSFLATLGMRLGITGALRNNVLSDLPIYLLMLIGYWAVLIIGLIAGSPLVTILGLFMIFLRMLQGIFMKLVAGNRFHAYDIIMETAEPYEQDGSSGIV